jgi:hypothetical protein
MSLKTEPAKTDSQVFGAGVKLLRPRNQKEKNALSVSGVDLMRKISEGVVPQASTAQILEVRTVISKNCEELIEQGARIRPLMSGNKQIGWVRGLHIVERKLLQRWIFDTNEFLAAVMKTCTTLTVEEINQLSGFEMRRLAELIAKMGVYDLSLFPYLSAFVTTSTSENLWYSRGTQLSSYDNRIVHFPDGHSMTILAPPEHAKLWATLCNYREAAKRRLDDNFNALMIVGVWAGKSAEPIRNDLRSAQKAMAVDSMVPWEEVVRIQRETDLDDGWAHSGVDDSVEGLQKELKGLFSNDKHEKFMMKFYEQQKQKAEAEKRQAEEMLARRGGPGVRSTIGTEVFTEQEVRQREQDLKKGRPVLLPVRDRGETPDDPEKRIQKYRS